MTYDIRNSGQKYSGHLFFRSKNGRMTKVDKREKTATLEIQLSLDIKLFFFKSQINHLLIIKPN